MLFKGGGETLKNIPPNSTKMIFTRKFLSPLENFEEKKFHKFSLFLNQDFKPTILLGGGLPKKFRDPPIFFYYINFTMKWRESC